MTDTITLRGFVATEIKSSTTPGGVPTASFRLGCPERRFDKAAGAWVESNMSWFTVQGYRQLAGNMGCSIKKGQKVIVVGKLKLRSWEKDGRTHHQADIDADAVGHDLRWGTANYLRNSNPQSADELGPANSGNPFSGVGGDGPDDDREEGEERDEDAAGIFLDDNGDELQLDPDTGELSGAAA